MASDDPVTRGEHGACHEDAPVLIRTCFAVVMLALATSPRPTLAADIAIDGSKMIISGKIFGQRELGDLVNQLAGNSAITTVVFKNFHLSKVNTQEVAAFAKFIRKRGLSTEVDGSCSPACGLAFMGGVQRRVAEAADPKKTYVSLRGSYRITGVSVEAYRPTFIALLQRLSDGKMPEQVAKLAYSMPVDGLLLFIDGRRVKNKEDVSVMACKDVRRRGLRDCRGWKGVDSHEIGVFTH